MNIKSIIPADVLRDFCHRNNIQRFAIFGSALRSDFTPESDIDILVEFVPGKVPGLRFFDLQDELSEMVGRTVDLNTLEWLSPYFRDKVLSEAQVMYDAA